MRPRKTKTRWWLVAVIAALGVVTAYYLGLSAWTGYHRSLFERALASRDWKLAEESLAKCRWAQPSRADWRLEAARLARRQGRLSEASRYLEQCTGDASLEVTVGLERCLLDIQSGQFGNSAAIDDYSRQHPDSTESMLIDEAQIRGSLAALNFTRANHYLNAWHKRRTSKSDRAAGLVWEASAQLLAQNVDGATATARSAVELDPASHEARLLLARLLAPSNPVEAEPHLAWLRDASPDYEETIYLQAVVARNLGQIDNAKAAADRLLKRSPDHVEGLLLRGRIALDERQFDEAAAWFRRAEQLAPERPSVLLAMLDHARLTGDTAKAEHFHTKSQAALERIRTMVNGTTLPSTSGERPATQHGPPPPP